MNIDENIDAILQAQKKQENCPFCGAGCYVPAHADDNENIQYAHGCECLLNLFLEKLDEKDSYHKNKYAKHCHNCGKCDGVDSTLPECPEDPPYKYRCKYCGHSLRTHKMFGEGMKFDLAKFNITWVFDHDGNPMLIFPSQDI